MKLKPNWILFTSNFIRSQAKPDPVLAVFFCYQLIQEISLQVDILEPSEKKDVNYINGSGFQGYYQMFQSHNSFQGNNILPGTMVLLLIKCIMQQLERT